MANERGFGWWGSQPTNLLDKSESPGDNKGIALARIAKGEKKEEETTTSFRFSVFGSRLETGHACIY